MPQGGGDRLSIDVTCAASDTTHADLIVGRARGRGVGDDSQGLRLYVSALGGVIEMQSKKGSAPGTTPRPLTHLALPGSPRPRPTPRMLGGGTVKRNAVSVVDR